MLLLQISFYNLGDKSFETDLKKTMASIEPFQKLYTIQKVYTIQKLYTIQDKIIRAFQKCHFFLKLSDWIKSYGHSFK